MHAPLSTYLHDHLAGATFAINLLEQLRNRPGLEQVAHDLLHEIGQDRAVLRTLADETGDSSSSIKEAASWLAEKISHLKLRHQMQDPLGTLEALEMLALGILGKQALWRSLQTSAPAIPRLQRIDFDALIDRAKAQHAIVEDRRLQAARTALCDGNDS